MSEVTDRMTEIVEEYGNRVRSGSVEACATLVLAEEVRALRTAVVDQLEHLREELMRMRWGR
jgi:hypothetical protein